MYLADGVGRRVLERDLPRGMSILINWSVTANTREQISRTTVFENYVADIEVDGEHIELALWDTGSDHSFDRVRALAYPDSHAILLCFDISHPDSLDNAQQRVRRKLFNT